MLEKSKVDLPQALSLLEAASFMLRTYQSKISFSDLDKHHDTVEHLKQEIGRNVAEKLRLSFEIEHAERCALHYKRQCEQLRSEIEALTGTIDDLIR